MSATPPGGGSSPDLLSGSSKGIMGDTSSYMMTEADVSGEEGVVERERWQEMLWQRQLMSTGIMASF